MARKVVITGLGSLSSLGSSASELWQSIMDKKVAYKAVPQADPKIKAKFFALLDEDSHRLDGFSKRNIKGLPLFARNALYSARQALRQAFGDGFSIEQLGDPFRRGVIMGTGWGGYDEGNANCMDYHRTSNASSFSTIQNMASVATAAVTMNWAFRGYQNTTVAACASGSIAIGDAFNVIRRGDADLMLAGGSESLKDTFNIWSIDIIGALSQEQSDIRKACCPFSLGRNGFILAEGASCVVLEDLETARKRGATILGEVVGYGNFSDAANLTAPAADLLARVHCIKQCLTQAEIEPDQIDYINAHGTSTQLNDLNETQSLKAALGNAAYDIPISSTKSYTGHQIGAAGAVETAICMKAFEHRTLPGTLHLDNPDPACDLNYLPNEHHRPARLNYALNLSFGFGGTNSVLLFKNARISHMTGVVQYSSNDIANWAQFSGDYNPIHFDAAASKRFGHASVVVHGMIAVLQALESVLGGLRENPGSQEWITVTQRLRIPIYPGEQLKLGPGARGPQRLALRSAASVKVQVDVETSDTYETGVPALSCTATDETKQQLGEISVDPAALATGRSALHDSFGWLHTDITFFQASAFAHFMRVHISTLERWAQRSLGITQPTLGITDNSTYTVVQTTHRAIVHRSWLDDDTGSLDNGLQLRFAPTALTTLAGGGCASVCEIKVRTDRQYPMFAKIGLLLTRNTKGDP